MKIRLNWDGLGMLTSLLCAIHCGLLPLLLPVLPVLGVNLVHNAYFEWGMILIAFLVGNYSLWHGWTRHHHHRLPFLLFYIGFSFLVIKQFDTVREFLWLALAVPLIITAHYINYRRSAIGKCHSPHHSH